MRRQIAAVAAILFSTALFIMGNGLLGVLIPVRGHLAGFSNLALGVIGSAYFAGFVIGCFAGPRLAAPRRPQPHLRGRRRHFGAASALLQSMFVSRIRLDRAARRFSAFAAACIYMVIESWLNDRATNETRGRIFSAYLTVNFSGLIDRTDAVRHRQAVESFALFSLSAIFYALCLIPMGLTRLPQPHAAQVSRLASAAPFPRVAGRRRSAASPSVSPTARCGRWRRSTRRTHGLNKGWLAIFMSVLHASAAR